MKRGPLWAEPHPADPRCVCWHRGRASHGKVSVDMQHPLAWAAGVLVRFRGDFAGVTVPYDVADARRAAAAVLAAEAHP